MIIAREAGRRSIIDCAFLFLIVILSTLPFLSKLGFYSSDDWGWETPFAQTSVADLPSAIWNVMASDPDLMIRPVHVFFIGSEFSVFGDHPFPIHLLSSAFLALTVPALYLAFLELGLARWIAFAAALNFGMLPHYATDKLWIASQQAILCLLFAALGIYALHRSFYPGRQLMWVVFATVSILLSILAYEVALGLIGGILIYTACRRWRETKQPVSKKLARVAGIVTVTTTLVAIGIVKASLQTRIPYHHHLLRLLSRLGGLAGHAVTQAALFNCWTYGIRLPAVLDRMYQHDALTVPAFAVSIFIAISVAVYIGASSQFSGIPNAQICLLLLLLGFLIFFLGYALFSLNPTTEFSTTGLNDRVTIPSAVGASCVELALAGLASCFFRPEIRRQIFAGLVGILCGVNCLTTCGTAYFWIDASVHQKAILRSVKEHVPELPKGSVLLLDGFCRYDGPGVVFDTDWDTTRSLQLTSRDSSIRGDVVSRSLRVDEDAINTTLYAVPRGHYPYGSNLYVYNVHYAALVPLPTKQATVNYFKAMNPSGNSGCPEEKEGIGTKVF